MANIIKPKRSNVANNTPTTSNLTSGEIGVNMADQKIWIHNGTSIVQIGGGKLSALGETSISSPSNGQALVYNGTNWANSSITASTATNIAGGIANQIPYQTGADTTSFIAAPAVTDTYLKWNGSAFSWSTVSASFNGGTVTGAVSITDNTTSTSTATGALIVTGGVGIGGSVHAGDYRLSGGNSLRTAQLMFVIDGGGSAITTGIKGDMTIPFNCTINSWRLLADVSGSIVVDIWEDTYANFPPTVADTITGSALPGITSATKNESSTLTGWTTALVAGDILRFNVNSASTLTRVTLSLQVTRT